MGKHNDNDCDKLLLREIYKKIVSIEEEVEKLKNKPEYHINIEKLDVQQLENMIFRLDALDIHELSGTLNIGNNFDSKKTACKPAGNNDKKRKGKKTCGDEEES
jgi:hypothetical protein